MPDSRSVDVFLGDCRLLLPLVPDGSVDAVVTDPPYELTSSRGSSGGFMGKAWDATGVAFDKGVWAECLRALKPGGHALVFGGTRTFHRVAVAMEDAGFEIRDSVAWVQSQGFPKSHNLAKAAAKAGVDPGPFAGWGSALKPAWEPILVARKPLDGTLLGNAERYGTGGLNIDGTRVGTSDSFGGGRNGSSGFADGYVGGSGWVPGPVSGRWPANVVLGHAEDCRVVGARVEEVVTNRFEQGAFPFGGAAGQPFVSESAAVGSAVYECVPGCPVALMDLQSGSVGAAAPASGPTLRGPSSRKAMAGGFAGVGDAAPAFHGDAGGASRFFFQATWTPADFPPFLYCAKAPGRERVEVDGVSHPTQKPVTLMRWLCRLVTPTGGTVLDPFAGSGTTLEAAVSEGFTAVGMELTAEYVPMIEARAVRAGGTVTVLDGSAVA